MYLRLLRNSEQYANHGKYVFLREINFHAYAVQFACSRCHLTGIIFTSNGNMRDDDDATGNSYATAAAAIRVFGFILVPFHYHDEFNYY